MGLFYLSMHQETSKKVSATLDTLTHYVSTWFILQLLRLWRMEKGKTQSGIMYCFKHYVQKSDDSKSPLETFFSTASLFR